MKAILSVTDVTVMTEPREFIGTLAAWATLAAGLSLAACTSGSTAQDLLGLSHMQDASGIPTRELLPEEKAVISHAVGLSVVNPNTAQFRWPRIANTEDGPTNYCGMANANPRRHHGDTAGQMLT